MDYVETALAVFHACDPIPKLQIESVDKFNQWLIRAKLLVETEKVFTKLYVRDDTAEHEDFIRKLKELLEVYSSNLKVYDELR